MHPTLSIIAFTVLSGAGFGLASLAALSGIIDAWPGLTVAERLSAGALGGGLAAAGLVSSTLHLANPRNAWRALFRVRTSWLSREAVLALLFYPCAAAWLAGLGWRGDAGWPVDTAAALTLALALAAVFCTGMIYASLRTIPQWHDALVPVNYVLLALASGAVLLAALVAVHRGAVAPAAAAATVALLAVAAAGKILYYYRIGRPRGLSINAALGMTQGRARLLESGQSGPVFLDKEFRYQVSPGALWALRVAAVLLAFLLPAALLAPVPGREAVPPGVAVIAAAAVIAGLGVERWLFFAEARHVVNLYYGRQRC